VLPDRCHVASIGRRSEQQQHAGGRRARRHHRSRAFAPERQQAVAAQGTGQERAPHRLIEHELVEPDDQLRELRPAPAGDGPQGIQVTQRAACRECDGEHRGDQEQPPAPRRLAQRAEQQDDKETDDDQQIEHEVAHGRVDAPDQAGDPNHKCFCQPQPVMGFGRNNEGEQDEIAGSRGHEQKGCNRVGRDETPEIIERGQIEQDEQSQGIDRGQSRYAGAPSQPVQR